MAAADPQSVQRRFQEALGALRQLQEDVRRFAQTAEPDMQLRTLQNQLAVQVNQLAQGERTFAAVVADMNEKRDESPAQSWTTRRAR